MPQANLVLNITTKDLPARLLERLVVIYNDNVQARNTILSQQRLQDLKNPGEAVFLFSAKQAITNVEGHIHTGQTTDL